MRLFQNQKRQTRMVDQPIEVAEHSVAMNKMKSELLPIDSLENGAEIPMDEFAIVDRVENENVQFDLQTLARRTRNGSVKSEVARWRERRNWPNGRVKLRLRTGQRNRSVIVVVLGDRQRVVRRRRRLSVLVNRVRMRMGDQRFVVGVAPFVHFLMREEFLLGEKRTFFPEENDAGNGQNDEQTDRRAVEKHRAKLFVEQFRRRLVSPGEQIRRVRVVAEVRRRSTRRIARR